MFELERVIERLRLTDVTAPLVDRLCGVLPVGPAAVWGGVADELAGDALWFARETAADEAAAWERAELLVGHRETRACLGARLRQRLVAHLESTA